MLYRYIFILNITLNRISESLRCLAPVLDVCKTENPTRDTTHGGACLEAPWPVVSQTTVYDTGVEADRGVESTTSAVAVEREGNLSR